MQLELIVIFYPWLNLILGLMIAIEALLLFVGMNYLAKSAEAKEWSSFKHNFILMIDIATGIGLVILSLLPEIFKSLLFYFLLAIILISHLYRNVDYFISQDIKFLHNKNLFIFNNIKLLISILSIILGLLLYSGTFI